MKRKIILVVSVLLLLSSLVIIFVDPFTPTTTETPDSATEVSTHDPEGEPSDNQTGEQHSEGAENQEGERSSGEEMDQVDEENGSVEEGQEGSGEGRDGSHRSQPSTSTPGTTQVQLELPAGSSPEENARNVAEQLRDLGYFIEEDELHVLFSGGGVGSLELERVSQTHQGLPVYGSNLLILRRGDTVLGVEGPIATIPIIDIEPAVTSDVGREALMSEGYEVQGMCYESELYIHAVFGSSNLAWCYQVVNAEGEQYEALVNAQTGSLITVVAMRAH